MLKTACGIHRSTSSRTMSVGASPRTGTLNSRDMQHSQLMNMSSGSQVISSSPPAPLMLSSLAPSPSSYQQQQQRYGMVQPGRSPPPQYQLPVQSTSSSPQQLSPRQLSPQQPLPVSPSAMSSAVTVVTVNDRQAYYVTSPTAGANTHTCLMCPSLVQ